MESRFLFLRFLRTVSRLFRFSSYVSQFFAGGVQRAIHREPPVKGATRNGIDPFAGRLK